MVTMPRSAASGPALLTDLYQLTMMQAYWREGMHDQAVYSLFARRLPGTRKYLLACGLADVLDFLETVRFTAEELEQLASLPYFQPDFLHWLRELRFTGDVYALPEGTPCFAGEPIVEVVAPIAEAQFAETFLLNQINLQTVLASKASRVVTAARGRPVVDFGLRRMQGTDAGLKSARAFHIAGIAATSNVLAGQLYGLPVAGTMGHSYIQAHDREIDAFRAFLQLYPQAILPVDTYDPRRGLETVIELARELGPAFRARGVRLDSGNLAELASLARRLLDEAGLGRLEIFASGGLDEYAISGLLGREAPIDAFGVGTDMGVSSDAPALDLAYKLTSYAGQGRLKTSPGKQVLPGQKQVVRVAESGRAVRDVVCRWAEQHPGRPLLRQVMRGGRRLPEALEDLGAARERARAELALLPDRIRTIEPDDITYPVELSPALRAYQQEVIARLGA